MSDQEIILAIQAGGVRAERALMHIYKKTKVKNDTIRYVRQNSGDKADWKCFRKLLRHFITKQVPGISN